MERLWPYVHAGADLKAQHNIYILAQDNAIFNIDSLAEQAGSCWCGVVR